MRPDSFASFDGTPIGFQEVGPSDAPVILLANGLGGTVIAYRYIIEHFQDRFRFLCWDYRGLYTSGRPLSGYAGLSVTSHAKDGLALLDHLGVDRFHGVGWSMGVQVMLEMQRLARERFTSLVLHNGVAGHPYRSLANVRAFERLMPPLLGGLQNVDGFVARVVQLAADSPWFVPLAIRAGVCHHDLDRDLFRTLARGFKQLDMHLYLEMLKQLGEHDAEDVLAEVRCPTLVLSGSADLLTPITEAQRMASLIPGARFEVVPGGTHYAAVEMPEVVNRALASFWLDPPVLERSHA